MLELILDGKDIKTKRELYDCIKKQIPVPVWFGENLDALYDLVTCDILPSNELTVILRNKNALQEHLDGYAGALVGLLTDLAMEDSRFTWIEE